MQRKVYSSFSDDEYPIRFNYDHDNLMVIITIIHNYAVKRIFVDQGSSVDILYNTTMANMNIHKRDLKPHTRNLIEFFSK